MTSTGRLSGHKRVREERVGKDEAEETGQGIIGYNTLLQLCTTSNSITHFTLKMSINEWQQLLLPCEKRRTHVCPDCNFCGKIGDFIPMHGYSNVFCHPIYARQPSKRKQGKCVNWRNCGNKSDATKVCLKCSTMDHVTFICHPKRNSTCMEEHIAGKIIV